MRALDTGIREGVAKVMICLHSYERQISTIMRPAVVQWLKQMPLSLYVSRINESLSFHRLRRVSDQEYGHIQIPYDITYMWNLKYDTNELSMKQKQTHRHRKQTCGCQGGKGGGGRMDWEFGISRCKLLHIE